MKKTKIFAAYLPQYHETSENNEFWGEGFTDWKAVKEAKPLNNNHIQPRIPLDNNYYDLSKVDSIKWQSNLAKKYGIDGFNIYHYWFKGGHKVLQKPAELLLNNKDIDIEFFFSWDNVSWVRSWSNVAGNSWSSKYDKNDKKNVLLEFSYENEASWKAHFDYLLPFFKDDRYYKISNKPVFVIIKNDGSKNLLNMYNCWNKLAINNGFEGIYFITSIRVLLNNKYFDAKYMYQPEYVTWAKKEAFRKKIISLFSKNTKTQKGYEYNYKRTWEEIIRVSKKYKNKRVFWGCFSGFDDTPRRGSNARRVIGETPELFEKYFSRLYKMSCQYDKELLFFTAWNEWGEGAYLEPDKHNKYAFLEAIKRVKDSVIC